MKKNLLIIILTIFLIIETFINSEYIIININDIFNIWKTSIFPSLFPIFIFSSILINYEIINYIPSFKLLNLTKSSSFIFLLSMFSGFPSSAKFIKELYDNNQIEYAEAENVLLISHFANPMFIIGTISYSLLNSKKLCLIIFISHYLSNIILSFFIKYNNSNSIKYKINQKSFTNTLYSSINNAVSTLLLILGTITFFSIICTILDKNLDLNETIKGLIFGILEMTQGIKKISETYINIKEKCTLISMILSFGGLSIHMQVFNILNGLNIKYKRYLKYRIIHSVLTGILCYLFFDIIY